MSMAFDTLRYSQRPQQVGISRDQAEAYADLARDMLLAELVTKPDLLATRAEIQNDAKALRSELQGEIRSLRAEFHSEIKLLEQRMTIRLGTMLAAAVGVIVAAQRYLG